MTKENIGEWISNITGIFESSGVPTARLDALILLEDAIGRDRAWLLANTDVGLHQVCESTGLTLLKKNINRRIRHEPLAYIRGKSEFYGREYLVTPNTLQPRSETETMITLIKNLLENIPAVSKTRSWKIVDVGTGSGCLAVTAKLELPTSEVYATDINNKALNIARKNAKLLGADVKFHLGNLVEPLSNIDLLHSSSKLAVLANLPYVPDSHTINKAALHEPKIAIFGGVDGLDLYRDLFAQILKFKLKSDYILTESLPFQHFDMQKLALSHGYKLLQSEDFIQVFINIKN
jgi:release factor glutamine methyltransferase